MLGVLVENYYIHRVTDPSSCRNSSVICTCCRKRSREKQREKERERERESRFIKLSETVSLKITFRLVGDKWLADSIGIRLQGVETVAWPTLFVQRNVYAPSNLGAQRLSVTRLIISGY